MNEDEIKATDSVLSEINNQLKATESELRQYIINEMINKGCGYDEVKFENHPLYISLGRLTLIKDFINENIQKKYMEEIENGL
jgi:hypothetical protein